MVPDMEGMARLVALHLKVAHSSLDKKDLDLLIVDINKILSVTGLDVDLGGLIA